MTLDQIDSTANERLGDHFLVPLLKGLTDNLRDLKARVRDLEGQADAEESYRQERLERSEAVDVYDVADPSGSTG